MYKKIKNSKENNEDGKKRQVNVWSFSSDSF